MFRRSLVRIVGSFCYSVLRGLGGRGKVGVFLVLVGEEFLFLSIFYSFFDSTVVR